MNFKTVIVALFLIACIMCKSVEADHDYFVPTYTSSYGRFYNPSVYRSIYRPTSFRRVYTSYPGLRYSTYKHNADAEVSAEQSN